VTRCALYSRVSLEEQAERYGLASQVRALRDYAQAHNYQVVLEVSDVDHSGATLERPALSQVRDLVRSRGVDVVLAYAPDRLSRDVAHISILWDEAKRRGAHVEFCTCRYEQTPEGKLMLQLLSGFSEFERTKIAERTLRGRREKARQGKVVGGRVTFGYLLENGALRPDPETADTVRQIFSWAVDGVSVRSITSRLSNSGIKPYLGGARWAYSTVRRILANETYAGTMYYNRRQRVDRTLTREWRKPDEWIELSAPPLIDRAVFDAVRERTEANRRLLSGRPSQRYLLKGLLRCTCGHTYAGCPSHGKRFYRCNGRDRVRSAHLCNAPLLHGEHTESAVWEAVASVFRDPRALRSVIESHRKELLGMRDSTAESARLWREIESLRRREASAAMALADPDLLDHYPLYKAQVMECRRQRQTAEREYAALSVQLPMDLDALCSAAAGAVDSLDFEGRRRFLAEVVDGIEVNRTDLAISCALPGWNRAQRADGVISSSLGMSFILNVHLKAA
jgi:site-specific DNA recombinase